KHTLALINPGGASTAGLLALAHQIQDGVAAAFGVRLDIEPVRVNVA
ncbi:MAG TPA: UDP-N-acetylenolpyruvoylglucosamine reductase, partial [Streptosporangiaceae bacterium]|nr:UDP-N-acetylenolpyruvoylglucosamine reductase [Streptosporangiaceae bacterium]